MNFSELVRARHSVCEYQSGVDIGDQMLAEIFADVLLSPSSFNCQHWKFVVVRESAAKHELRRLSYGQAQVEQCAAAILVCGRLDAYEDAAKIYASSAAQTRNKYVPMIDAVYAGKPELQREEAIRSGAMAAMSLMYAAKSHGWDSGPMIGFDATAVAKMLRLDETTIPVMMVVIGKALNGQQPPRGYRRPLAEVVKLETLDGAELG